MGHLLATRDMLDMDCLILMRTICVDLNHICCTSYMSRVPEIETKSRLTILDTSHVAQVDTASESCAHFWAKAEQERLCAGDRV